MTKRLPEVTLTVAFTSTKTELAATRVAPAYDLTALRALFPHTARTAYFNHAGMSPLAVPVKAAMDDAIELIADGSAFWDSGAAEQLDKRLHANLARLINATAEEIALIPNTSLALNLVALSLPTRPGQNIIICDKEFPSNVYPWMNLARRRGLELRIAPPEDGGLTVRRLKEYADEHTLLVAVSAVEFLTGFRADLVGLGAFCREHGSYFAVDGIQSLGHMPTDVRAANVDFLAAGALKSLMGPPGIGFLYIRHELLDRLDMAVAGAASVKWSVGPHGPYDIAWTRYALDFRADAARFELGTANWVGMAGLDAAVTILMELGLANIDAWTTHLSDVLLDDLAQRGYQPLTPRDPALHGPIVTFAAPDPHGLVKRLAEAQIVAGVREGYVRISNHCYNTLDEVKRIGEVLDREGGKA